MRKVDKSEWLRGPWDAEPDELFWTDEATGYRCRLWRNSRGGHLCGYVAVPESHPLHGISYSAVVPESLRPFVDRVMEGPIGKRSAIDVFCLAGGMAMEVGMLFDTHGGITFSDEVDGEWRYGFDCAHANDLQPGYEVRYRVGGIYRDVEYVKAECASLARQLKEMANA